MQDKGRERAFSVKKHVDFRLRTEKNRNLHLIMEDEGKGFQSKRTLIQNKYANHFGLMGMGEQAKLLGGTFTVESANR